MSHIILIGAPIDSGKRRPGCLMGPDAHRTAGLAGALRDLGHKVSDWGNLTPADHRPDDAEAQIYALKETIGWTHRLVQVGQDAAHQGIPVFLGGDHAVSLGSVAGVARHAAALGRPQFLLWLDAHSDFHTPETTQSGHLHGTPVAYVTGQGGFAGFPDLTAPITPKNVCMIGLRSVDAAERVQLEAIEIHRHDMREIDETGIARPLAAFLKRVEASQGLLHVSLDVDFLDPQIAPAVGTTVPGGATTREAHLVMEMIHDSGLMTSISALRPLGGGSLIDRHAPLHKGGM